ncbi:hypothetical protein REB14_14280 [Chryseobacterium sp. ES2]|uniref:Uncharacterized protein n=1 Tax=Chryseobacterium metallicongregator TaxID=3073042 RepID=A0ABU1E698_9FLAO|nr:hypothetical protein [Chryseobacterium sp. ES2]MDR4953344.1 hypothetical protein [Chryseobacterium sp. ES2]
MKTLRFLAFIPAFFIVVFLLNLIINFVAPIIGFENMSKQNWFAYFTQPFIIVAISTIIAVQIYPNNNKRIGIILVGVLLIIFCSITIYSMNELKVSMRRQLVIFTAAFAGYLVAGYNSWRQHYV